MPSPRDAAQPEPGSRDETRAILAEQAAYNRAELAKATKVGSTFGYATHPTTGQPMREYPLRARTRRLVSLNVKAGRNTGTHHAIVYGSEPSDAEYMLELGREARLPEPCHYCGDRNPLPGSDYCGPCSGSGWSDGRGRDARADHLAMADAIYAQHSSIAARMQGQSHNEIWDDTPAQTMADVNARASIAYQTI